MGHYWPKYGRWSRGGRVRLEWTIITMCLLQPLAPARIGAAQGVDSAISQNEVPMSASEKGLGSGLLILKMGPILFACDDPADLFNSRLDPFRVTNYARYALALLSNSIVLSLMARCTGRLISLTNAAVRGVWFQLSV